MIFIIKAQVSKTLSYEDKKNTPSDQKKIKIWALQGKWNSDLSLPIAWDGWYSSSAGDSFLPQ